MDESLTIAYLSSRYGRTADTFVRTEVEQLRQRGYIVHTFSIRRPDREESVGEQVRREQRQTDYILSHGWGRLLLATAVNAIRHPRRMLRSVIHAIRTAPAGLGGVSWQMAYLIEASYLARRLRTLNIRHIHNHIPCNSATVCMLASELTGVPFSMTVHGPTIFYEPHRWALSEKIKRAAFTACISHFCRSQCMLFADERDWARLKVIRCGVSRAFLSPDEGIAAIPQSRRFVYVGRLTQVKGPALLIEAVAILKAEGLSIELEVIGDGEARAALQSQIDRLKLRGDVRLFGYRDSSAVREHLRHARALVLPSFAEGLPVVLMEALAMRRPVITTWIAGIPELIESGRHGWLVAPGNVQQLATALREAATVSPARLQQMGQEGAARVMKLHDATNQAAALDELFRQAIGASRQTRNSRPVQDTHEAVTAIGD